MVSFRSQFEFEYSQEWLDIELPNVETLLEVENNICLRHVGTDIDLGMNPHTLYNPLNFQEHTESYFASHTTNPNIIAISGWDVTRLTQSFHPLPASTSAAGDAGDAFSWGSGWPAVDGENGAKGLALNEHSETFDIASRNSLNLNLGHAIASHAHTGLATTQGNNFVDTILDAPPVTLAASHNRSRKNICPHKDCSRAFGRLGDLKRHFKSHFPGDLPCTFKGCGKKFYRRDKLRDHQRRGHKKTVA